MVNALKDEGKPQITLITQISLILYGFFCVMKTA